MAFQAKDSSWHHSASRASLHDEMNTGKGEKSDKAGKGGQQGGKSPMGGKDKDPGEHDTDVSHMDIGEVVSKHGPAHHVVMHHDHEGKLSTVTSHHGEKGKAQMHHSEHDGEEHVVDAHEHAMKAAGHDGEEKDEEANETPGEEMAEDEMSEQPATAGIPGIKS